jgi:hypothetical protein
MPSSHRSLLLSQNDHELLIFGIPENYHELKVYDCTGKLIHQQAIDGADLRLTNEHFTPGIYCMS